MFLLLTFYLVQIPSRTDCLNPTGFLFQYIELLFPDFFSPLFLQQQIHPFSSSPLIFFFTFIIATGTTAFLFLFVGATYIGLLLAFFYLSVCTRIFLVLWSAFSGVKEKVRSFFSLFSVHTSLSSRTILFAALANLFSCSSLS